MFPFRVYKVTQKTAAGEILSLRYQYTKTCDSVETVRDELHRNDEGTYVITNRGSCWTFVVRAVKTVERVGDC